MLWLLWCPGEILQLVLQEEHLFLLLYKLQGLLQEQPQGQLLEQHQGELQHPHIEVKDMTLDHLLEVPWQKKQML